MSDEQTNGETRNADHIERLNRLLAMLNLTVSDDNMAAFINPEDSDFPSFDIRSVKESLGRAGVVHGLADDSVLSDCLSGSHSDEKPWKIAAGTPPDPGKESRIRYCFNTNPLIVGIEDETGKIDFKNRGEVPQVKAGDMLAEVLPGTPGRAGMDIFGTSLPPPEHRPAKLLFGKGAYSHPDGLKLYAQIDGRPELTSEGKVCVFPDLVIPGDVGYATGHVEFDGDVEVRGAILDGFRVRAKNLRTEEINKADVAAGGNIIVAGGIIGSRVQADGALTCKHIHTSTIEVLGDVAVETAIFDSEIKTNGKCTIRNGRILSSAVSAKLGVEAFDVGSDSSEACELLVGVDGFLKSTIDKLNGEIDLIIEKKRELENSLAAMKRESEDLETEIGNLAQEEDRVRRQMGDMERQIGRMVDAGRSDDPLMPKVRGACASFKEKLDQITAAIEEGFERQERLEENIENQKAEIRKASEGIGGLKERIEREIELSATDKGAPAVKVAGTICSGTVVRGPKAIVKLADDERNVTIREVQNDADDVRTERSMAILRNR